MSTPHALLDQLEQDLDNLELVLQPLLSKSWSETLEALEKPLERAKMNTMAAFGICDLIWSELKSLKTVITIKFRPTANGQRCSCVVGHLTVFLKIKASATREPIDFESHPVMRELVSMSIHSLTAP